MENVRRVGLIAVVAALLAWLPGQADAQEVGFSVDAYGGWGIPASNLGVIQDAGPSAGLGVEYMLTDRIFARASGQANFYDGRDADELDARFPAPDITTYHFGGGLGVKLAPPEETAWDVSLSLEVGGTKVSSDAFPEDAEQPGQFVDMDADEEPTDDTEFSETYFSLSPGLRVGYTFANRLNVFVRSQPYFAFADKVDTAAFVQFDDDVRSAGFQDPAAQREGPEELWGVPISAGVQLNF